MITSQEIADIAGVSRATVVRVLYNKGKVSKKNKEIISNIIKEHGYTPNPVGQALALQKKKIRIGIVLQSLDNDIIQKMKEAIEEAINNSKGFKLKYSFIEIKGFDEKNQLNAIEKLEKENILGLLIVALNTKNVIDKLKELENKGVSIVTLNSPLNEPIGLCHVGINYYKSGALSAGCIRLFSPYQKKRILIITGSFQMKGQNQRIEGFSKSVKDNSDIEVVDIIECNDSNKTAYNIFKNYYKKKIEINCVYLTAHGSIGVCQAIKDFQLEKNVSVFCYDESQEIINYIKSGIIVATVVHDLKDISYIAVESLFNYLVYNTKPPFKEHLIQPRIYIKESIETVQKLV